MNNRLTELKKRAMVKEHSHGAFGESESYWKLDEDKFAELIIKDAIDECRKEWYDLNNAPKGEDNPRAIGIRIGQKGGVIKCIHRLTKHFGVDQ